MLEGTARLAIRLMGAPEISARGIPLTLNHVKSRALLYYLGATGQAHTRSHLATLLWGESAQSEAHHSLRSSLYHLRKALHSIQADDILIGDGEALSLRLDSYECDVLAFHRLLAQDDEAALVQAATLHRGSFLQGFTVTDAPLFDDWQQIETMRLNQAYFEALERLTIWAESCQAWTSALGFAQTMIQIDPLAESAQQRLMRLYLRQGEVGLALRQYRQFENQLRQELGIIPSRETRALYEEVLRHQRDHVTGTTTPTRPYTRRSNLLPFVGREEFIHRLSETSDQVKDGSGATILIQGEGGIGKSRLLHEFALHLIHESRPWIVLQGACSPFDDLLSHGPFIEALQNGTAEDLDDLLADSDVSFPDARGRFFWHLLQTIRSMSESAPLLLIIEDLQWANSSTLNLFGFLSMRLHHLPVILAGTVQHAEAIPALQRLITLGRRRHELHLFSLMPLALQATEDLLNASGVNPISVEMLTEWLHDKSGGNPFLLSEILAQLRAEEILRRAGDGWQLDATRWLRWKTRFTLPETSYDLVAWRLTNISPEARGLLDVLAVAAQPVPETILRHMPGIWTALLPTLIDDLLARGLLWEGPERAMLALPHHLLRETLLHRLSNLRRRMIHRQLAEAMETQSSTEGGIWSRQIALHAVAGEDIERARAYGMGLLSELPHEYTGAETVDFVQHLHDLLTPGASPAEMVRIACALGMLHQSLGHLEVAAHWHQQTLGWAQKANDLVAQVQAYLEMSELALMSNDYRTAIRAAQEGLTKISVSSETKATFSTALQSSAARAHRLLGAALAMEGSNLAAAEEHLQNAVSVQRQMENQGDLCAVLFELGNVAAQRGQLQRALDFYEESARVAEAGRIYYYLALAHNNFAYHSLLLGQIEAAQQSVAQGIKVAEAYDLLAALLHLYSTNGEVNLSLKEWRAAEESFRSGLALAEELGSLERQAGYRGGLALVARDRRDLDAAKDLLKEALALLADQGYWHLRTRLQLWLAETLFDQADYKEASKTLEYAMGVARSQKRTLLVEEGERLQARLIALQKN